MNTRMSYEMIDEGDGLVFRISGTVTATGLMDATVAGWQHPSWDTMRYQIWDFSKAAEIRIDNTNALAFADMEISAKRNRIPMRIASVVADQKMKSICERFAGQVSSESISAATFLDEADARQWIAEGVESGDVEAKC
ncbi:MAG: hypothetical protein RH946_08630 [Rhodospirillales bacterium]